MGKTTTGGQNRQKWGLPSLASYQGQYLVLALGLVMLLLSVAFLGYRHVTLTTQEQIQRTESRSHLEIQVSLILQKLQEIENWLNRQVMQPGIRQKIPLTKKITALDHALSRLLLVTEEMGQERLRKAAFNASSRLPEFTTNVREFLRISYDNSLRFPSTNIMKDHMRPAADNVVNLLNELIFQQSWQPDQAYWSFYSKLFETRHTWQQLMSEFRLLVANRFGVFSDNPENGMDARARNIELYYQQMQEQLNRLESLSNPDLLFTLDNDLWPELRTHTRTWHHYYQRLLANLRSDGWRLDLTLYNKLLSPQIEAIRNDLDILKKYLHQEAASDIKGLTDLASHLTQSILFLALAGIVLVLVAYLYLRTRILHPIAVTATALRREAAGDDSIAIPTPKLKETRELVEAFAEMRQQVNKRQQGLDHLAHHDPLTQLPNRMLFKDRLAHAIKIAQRNHQCLALMFMDLDNFKQINDTMGHRAGDELLLQVAYRLKQLIRSADTVARLGGDEFAILLENIGTEQQAATIAQKILDTIARPFLVAENEFHITGSIGIAAAPCNASFSDDLIRDADTAMYEAKNRGKNNYHLYSRKLYERVTSQLSLERELRQAIIQNELLFFYQPIVDAVSNQLVEVEALLRWQSANGELRYPGEFLSCLLNLKQSRDHNQRLLQDISRLQDQFLQQHDIALHVSLNLAPCTLRDPLRHKRFIEVLRRSNHPQMISLEITEDTLLEDLNQAQTFLEELKNMGIPLSLDDFGTGQSSLNHLRFFPFDRIKIDREFVANVPENQDDAMLVRAIIQLAHNFGMSVVAEGVETELQRRFLIDAECDYLQGYLISRPVPEAALLETIRGL